MFRQPLRQHPGDEHLGDQHPGDEGSGTREEGVDTLCSQNELLCSKLCLTVVTMLVIMLQNVFPDIREAQKI